MNVMTKGIFGLPEFHHSPSAKKGCTKRWVCPVGGVLCYWSSLVVTSGDKMLSSEPRTHSWGRV